MLSLILIFCNIDATKMFDWIDNDHMSNFINYWTGSVILMYAYYLIIQIKADDQLKHLIPINQNDIESLEDDYNHLNQGNRFKVDHDPYSNKNIVKDLSIHPNIQDKSYFTQLLMKSSAISEDTTKYFTKSLA